MGSAIDTLYPAGLRALVEIVHLDVPEAMWCVGPYGPFLALIEQNIVDWENRREARSHLIGMGMGSIYDLGGPGEDAGVEEVARFGRFDEGLRWTHNVTWRCAERWVKHEARWSDARDEELLRLLEDPRDGWRLGGLRCRACAWRGTTRDDIDYGVEGLQSAPRLRRLREHGGAAFARWVMAPPDATTLAWRAELAAGLGELAEAAGVARIDGYLAACPACGASTIGSPIALDRDALRALAARG